MSLRLKNTFLAFEDANQDVREVRSAPLRTVRRATSAESLRESPKAENMHSDIHDAQIAKLNNLLKVMSNGFELSPKADFSCESQCAFEDLSPSLEYLKQLHRKLEEVCQPRCCASSEHHSGESCNSIRSRELPEILPWRSALCSSNLGLASTDKIRRGLSSNSISTLASEHDGGHTPQQTSVTWSSEDEQFAEFGSETSQRSSCAVRQTISLQQCLGGVAPSDQNEQNVRNQVAAVEHDHQKGVDFAQQHQHITQKPRLFLSSLLPSGSRASSPESRDSQQFNFRGQCVASAGADFSLTLANQHLPTSGEDSTKRDVNPTTLMIRNLPNQYTQQELILELQDLGFAGTFDFLYIPVDKVTTANVGYAFVNFLVPSHAEKFMQVFHKHCFRRHKASCSKLAAISVAHIQGLEANLAHYQNSAVNTSKVKQNRPVVMANISSELFRPE